MVGCTQFPQADQSIDQATEESNNLEASKEKATTTITETNSITPFTQNDTGIPNLSFNSLNPIQPEDVLKEIRFIAQAQMILGYDDYTIFGHPHVRKGTLTSFQWMHPIHITTCGWQTDEKIQSTLEFPDGSTITNTVVAEWENVSIPLFGTANMDIIDKLDAGDSVPTAVRTSLQKFGKFLSSNTVVIVEKPGSSWRIVDGVDIYHINASQLLGLGSILLLVSNCGNYEFVPEELMPSGKYSLSFEGASGLLYHGFYIEEPGSSPTLVQLDDKLFLYNFQPHETVRIIVYLGTLFAGWTSFSVDANGQLWILDTYTNQHLESGIIYPQICLNGIGNESGQASTNQYGCESTNSAYYYCPGAPAPHLKSGDSVRVISPEGAPIVYLPKINSHRNEIAKLILGEEIRILSSQPRCVDGISYWETSRGYIPQNNDKGKEIIEISNKD